MKKNNYTLRRKLFTLMLGYGLFGIIVIALLLAYYFSLGLNVNTKYILEREASHFALQYNKGHEPKLPDSSFLNSYRNLSDIPETVLALFPEDQHKHRKMHIFDYHLDLQQRPQALSDSLTTLCDGTYCEMVFFYTYQLDESNWLYLTILLAEHDFDAVQDADFESIAFRLIPITLTFFVTTLILAFVMINKVNKPIRAIADWANNLKLEDIGKQPPNFSYRELDTVAECLKESFERIGQVLENEHNFLQNASHELRTPIATIKANIELLEKVRSSEVQSELETESLGRLKRASHTAKQLMETILWLSRDTSNYPDSTLVKLEGLLDDIIEDNKYLLIDRNVTIKVKADNSNIQAPEALCRITLLNLIRNAFQYTIDGTVTITIENNVVSVENNCAYQQEDNCESNDYGFGVGLKLVEQITNKMSWDYNCYQSKQGHFASIHFITI